MDSLLRADTLRLREHEDIIRREQRLVRLIEEQLRQARRYALPDDEWRCNQLLEKAGALEQYFRGMEDQVDRMEYELARLSISIGATLDEAGRSLQGLKR